MLKFVYKLLVTPQSKITSTNLKGKYNVRKNFNFNSLILKV